MVVFQCDVNTRVLHKQFNNCHPAIPTTKWKGSVPILVLQVDIDVWVCQQQFDNSTVTMIGGQVKGTSGNGSIGQVARIQENHFEDLKIAQKFLCRAWNLVRILRYFVDSNRLWVLLRASNPHIPENRGEISSYLKVLAGLFRSWQGLDALVWLISDFQRRVFPIEQIFSNFYKFCLFSALALFSAICPLFIPFQRWKFLHALSSPWILGLFKARSSSFDCCLFLFRFFDYTVSFARSTMAQTMPASVPAWAQSLAPPLPRRRSKHEAEVGI